MGRLRKLYDMDVCAVYVYTIVDIGNYSFHRGAFSLLFSGYTSCRYMAVERECCSRSFWLAWSINLLPAGPIYHIICQFTPPLVLLALH